MLGNCRDEGALYVLTWLVSEIYMQSIFKSKIQSHVYSVAIICVGERETECEKEREFGSSRKQTPKWNSKCKRFTGENNLKGQKEEEQE